MAIDFSVEPFFDDYSDDKKFYKILFRPGYAVQARELTQLQTIIQQQISRHGDHIFKEGSMVIPGQISYDLSVDYVKLTFASTTNVKPILDSLLGKDIRNSRGLIAKVINYTLAEGDDLNTIFVKYQNTIQDNAGNNVGVFDVDDFLSPVDGTSGLDVVVADTEMPIGKGSTATIQRGIYYIKKSFVLVQDQTIVLDKYTSNSSYRVGLQYNEEIVYPEQDESLLDNSLGSPNYSAPGAARHYIDLVLTKLPLNSDEDETFIDLLRLREGRVLFKIDRSQYAELEKTLARRTYDESGDYALSPFGIQVKEFRNNLRGDWAPSEKFVQGDLIKVPVGNGIHFWYFVAVTNGISSQNRPTTFSNAAAGTVDSINDNTVTWEFMLYPNFNQGINTFTAGDPLYSQFTLNDHIRLDGMLALGVEGGKAYVRGYEIEKIATEYLPIEKSRYLPEGSAALCEYFDVDTLPEVTDSISSQKTANIDVSMGSYVIGNNVKYLPNLTQLVEVNLHSAVYGSATTGTIIGKARVRALEKHINSGEFKVFLFDIRMNAGKDFKNVKSIYTTATAFATNIIQTNNETILQNPQGSSLIFNLPDYAIANVIETTYSVVIPFTATATGNTMTIAKPIGYTFESVSDASNYIITKSVGGDHVNATSLVVNPSGALVIGVADNGAYNILATLKRADQTDASALRTSTDASPIALTTAVTAQQPTITLNHSYVTRIVSVTMDSRGFNQAGGPIYNTDITNRYTFNDGQFNTHIALSSISLLPGATRPVGSILIKYEYLASTTDAGDFITADSYTHSTSRIRYDQIPSISGVALRDCVDFRPYQVGASFQLKYFPKFGTTASFKYVNYLARIDNISLTSVGKFFVSRGIPSERATEAGTPASSMKLAQLSIEPYTFKRGDQFGVIINRYENKRYTMRDIGKLERRIQDLEYYTSLTLLEVETKSMRIVDSEGFERYQNGFLVDSFDGQGVGNAASEDWNASIDQQNKELRPFFSQKQVALLENVNAATKNYRVSGDLVTLPFTETVMITQPKASMSESVNPYELYSWKGFVTINPWSDTWFSTSYRPDIIINDESQYNAIVAKAEQDGILGTVWNSWQTVFSSTKSLATRLENLGAWSKANTEILNTSNNGGTFWRNRATFTADELDIVGTVPGQLNRGVAGTRILTIETQAVETQASRTGTRSFVVDKVDSRVLEDRLVDTQVVPYIRPRAVLFTGYGFKPSTNMFAFFDNIMVNDYIIPATRIEVTRITKTGTTLYPHKFDVERNAGSAVSNIERTVNYSEGVQISGTVSVTAGSATVTGLATSFTTQIQANDILNFGGNLRFRVTAVTSNTQLTISPAFNGTTTSDISVRVIGPKHTTEEVEVAFNHGEVIKEVNGNGNTAIVVGQEVFGGKFYLYVMNIKGNGQFSTAANAYFEGEYTSGSDKPRVKFVPASRQDFTTLQTTFTGLLCGIFRIPSNPILKFRTGTRELVFSNDPNTNSAIRSSRESTSGGAIYEAKGLIEIMQRTIISTRTANIVAEQVSDTNTVVTTTDRLTRDTGWYDPLAQTFQIQNEGGAFLTSVDVFFAARDAKIPVRVEIREVVNGYPGSTVLPFSVVEKKAEEVIISDNSSVATNFKFTSPVFCQNGVEYALVVLSDSAAWRVWISQTEQVDVLTGQAILSQAYNGVFFKSQNGSTWTADQTQDMKFVIRRAEFGTNPVSIELIPPKLGLANLGFNPFNMITGSRRCRVTHRNHGMIAGEFVTFKSRQVIDSVNGIPAANIFDIPHTILSAELDSYVVEFPGTVNSSASGQVGGGFISASENYEFQTALAEIAEIAPPGTSISYTANVINHGDEVTSYSIVAKENYTFEETKVYPSAPNYSNVAFPSGLSISATLTPATGNRSISPVIDLGRLALTLVSNKVDSPGLEIVDPVLDIFPVTNPGSPTELGDGKPIDLVDLNNDTVFDTIVINSVIANTLFTNMNNNLNAGDVLRFTYSGITDAVRNMVIVEKTQEIVLDEFGEEASINLYFTLEGFNDEVLVETGVGQTVVIQWLSHYKDDYAALGSSTHSKYVTKKINFSRPSDMLKIMFAAAIPAEAEVEIYYKTGLAVDGDFITSRYFLANPRSYKKSENEFTEVIADVEGLSPFDSVIVKLVMKSINKAKVPRIKDFRVIAIAA
jgi:hypothetical protein